MSVVHKKYQELAPRGHFLSDVVVLSQAWKKTHAFIRRHNWYADVLELDVSTIDLESRLKEWAADVARDEFMPIPLKLVPAPKNSKWEFTDPPPPPTAVDWLTSEGVESSGWDPEFEDWRPKFLDDEERGQKLRPLAHLTIRDQSLATAVMICLAEAIETAQGDSSEGDLDKARALGIVSYGNRLHCLWDSIPGQGSRARFSWGNSRTYRQYFQDYRLFLARPRRVCAERTQRIQPRRELVVVSLDLKSYFDRVDISALLRELKRIEREYAESVGLPEHLRADEDFWKKVERVFRWRWRDEDQQHAPLIFGEKATELELGLPQGLVASGFLANAYLLGFDSAMHGFANTEHELAGGVTLLDYCRYVDDIRIVVEVDYQPGGRVNEEALEQVKEFVKKRLQEHGERIAATKALELSERKCTATPYRSISAQSSLSTLMDVLNADLSGPFDFESLMHVAGGLDGLLWIADQIEDPDDPVPSRLALASVSVPATDVRDDTVKRFVATRLAQLLRHRLAMTDLEGASDHRELLVEKADNGAALAHEFETTARRLIKCWAENPSLALLLRCGLDLYPHPKLLAPVIEALMVKLFPIGGDLESLRDREVRVAEYVLSDLFRAGAVETGFRPAEEYPATADILGYREDLAVVARRILSDRVGSPWYLQQQAYLFLASVGDFSMACRDMERAPELADYSSLQRTMMFVPARSEELLRVLPLALVGQQIIPNRERFAAWLADGLRATTGEGLQASVINTVALNRPDLLTATLGPARAGRSPKWRKLIPSILVEASRRATKKRTGTSSGLTRTLLQIMSDSDNVFGQENGILMLADALLRTSSIEDRLAAGLTAADIELECADWGRILSLSPECSLRAKLLPEIRGDVKAAMYEKPEWVDDEKAWLYGLGRILRAALTGEFDFTSKRFMVTEEIGRYSGLRSTWFKRRFGLMNSARGLLDEPGPVSPWLSGFISTLLQWPGVEFRANSAAAAGDARSAAELLALVEARISTQRALYGHRSRTPMYVIPTDDGAELKDRPLKVAIVQTMRPKLNEFDAKDPLHWTASAMAQHRRHLAEVCRLASQKLRAWATAKNLVLDGDGDEPVVDVILFPELAVHPEHVSLLRRFSDKLRANIFAGLTFVESPRLRAPVNQGLWLVRTESPGYGRSIQYIWQGKQHPMKLEREMGIKPHRPHLTLVELPIGAATRTRLAAAICYDATDLDLVADLRDRSDVFLVAALNKDVQTFDNMVAALHFHMYQPVILANSGEFGGSSAQVPLPMHDRLVAHVHGNNQVAVSVFEIDPSPFKKTTPGKPKKEPKAPPAGYAGRPN